MENNMICEHCGNVVSYDIKRTIYLKCNCCGNVLVDRRVKEADLLTIIDHGKTGDNMWVDVKDCKGNVYTYSKKVC